jgi:hypothetical protein
VARSLLRSVDLGGVGGVLVSRETWRLWAGRLLGPYERAVRHNCETFFEYLPNKIPQLRGGRLCSRRDARRVASAAADSRASVERQPTPVRPTADAGCRRQANSGAGGGAALTVSWVRPGGGARWQAATPKPHFSAPAAGPPLRRSVLGTELRNLLQVFPEQDSAVPCQAGCMSPVTPAPSKRCRRWAVGGGRWRRAGSTPFSLARLVAGLAFDVRGVGAQGCPPLERLRLGPPFGRAGPDPELRNLLQVSPEKDSAVPCQAGCMSLVTPGGRAGRGERERRARAASASGERERRARAASGERRAASGERRAAQYPSAGGAPANSACLRSPLAAALKAPPLERLQSDRPSKGLS